MPFSVTRLRAKGYRRVYRNRAYPPHPPGAQGRNVVSFYFITGYGMSRERGPVYLPIPRTPRFGWYPPRSEGAPAGRRGPSLPPRATADSLDAPPSCPGRPEPAEVPPVRLGPYVREGANGGLTDTGVYFAPGVHNLWGSASSRTTTHCASPFRLPGHPYRLGQPSRRPPLVVGRCATVPLRLVVASIGANLAF